MHHIRKESPVSVSSPSQRWSPEVTFFIRRKPFVHACHHKRNQNRKLSLLKKHLFTAAIAQLITGSNTFPGCSTPAVALCQASGSEPITSQRPSPVTHALSLTVKCNSSAFPAPRRFNIQIESFTHCRFVEVKLHEVEQKRTRFILCKNVTSASIVLKQRKLTPEVNVWCLCDLQVRKDSVEKPESVHILIIPTPCMVLVQTLRTQSCASSHACLSYMHGIVLYLFI